MVLVDAENVMVATTGGPYGNSRGGVFGCDEDFVSQAVVFGHVLRDDVLTHTRHEFL
jgi:hypothetical protein